MTMLCRVLALGGSQSPAPAAHHQAHQAHQEPVAHKSATSEHHKAPEPKSLYYRAAATQVPDYTIVHQDTTNGDGKRIDAFIITNHTDDREALGAVLEDIQLKTDADLTVGYFSDSKTAYQHDELFANGQLAATAMGKSYMTGEQTLRASANRERILM
jgi:hypothetical protein